MRAFEAHLAGCDGCTEYLEQMRTTIRLVGTLTPDDLSPGAEDSAAAGIPRLEAKRSS